MLEQQKKRETAYKLRVGDILRGNQIFEEREGLNKRLIHIELGDRKIVRVNIAANVVDKFESSGGTRFASITLDDGSGQIRAKLFGEDINKFNEINQGDTLIVIGILKFFNQELYILPEIMRKQDPRYLLVRKLENEKFQQGLKTPKQKQEIKAFRDQIIELIRNAEANEGIDKDEIIMKIKAPYNIISEEIQKLLEDGIIYESRPGKVRYLG